VFVPGSKRSFDPDATSEYGIPRSTQYYDYHWNSVYIQNNNHLFHGKMFIYYHIVFWSLHTRP
jgi:hypothetical protein